MVRYIEDRSIWSQTYTEDVRNRGKSRTVWPPLASVIPQHLTRRKGCQTVRLTACDLAHLNLQLRGWTIPLLHLYDQRIQSFLLWICVESTDRLSGNRIQLGIVDFCSSSKALWHRCVLEFKSWVGFTSFVGFTGFGPSTQRPSGWWVLLGVCLGFARLVILQLMKIGSLLYKWATQLKLKFRIAVEMNFLCYNRGTHHSMCVQKHKA
jgi:hypothetical protein